MDTIKGECAAAGRNRRAGADQAGGVTAKLAGTLRRAGHSRSAWRDGIQKSQMQAAADKRTMNVQKGG